MPTKETLKNIQIGDKALLKGDLTKRYSAVIMISDTIKTETLPKGTRLPKLMRYRVSATQEWTEDMQVNICDFIMQEALQGLVLVVSDKGDSRAPAVLVRFLIKLGLSKTDSVAMIKDKTGYEPDSAILKAFPEIDEQSVPDKMAKQFGAGKGTAASVAVATKWYGLSDKEAKKIRSV